MDGDLVDGDLRTQHLPRKEKEGMREASVRGKKACVHGSGRRQRGNDVLAKTHALCTRDIRLGKVSTTT